MVLGVQGLKENQHGIKIISVDSGYRGSLIERTKKKYGYESIISPKIKD